MKRGSIGLAISSFRNRTLVPCRVRDGVGKGWVEGMPSTNQWKA